MADVEKEILLQANLFLLLGLKRRHRQLQNRRKHRFWVQKVAFSIASNNDHTPLLCCGIWSPPPPQINYISHRFFPAIGLFVSVFEFLTVTVVNALISRNFLHKFVVTNATLFNAAMFRTNMRLLQTDIRALLLRSVESWVGIQITIGYVSIADRRTLVSIWSHNRNWSQTIADDRRSVFPYDRRRSQNFLRSAIRDPRSSAIIWKPALNKLRAGNNYYFRSDEWK